MTQTTSKFNLKDYYTIQQYAAYIGVSHAEVRQMIQAGVIKGVEVTHDDIYPDETPDIKIKYYLIPRS